MPRGDLTGPALFVLASCALARADGAKPAASEPAAVSTAAAAEAEHASESVVLPVRAIGWLELTNDAWVPVLDEAGKALCAMHDAYAHGDKRDAGMYAHRTSAELRRDERVRDPHDKARLLRAAERLDALGRHLAAGARGGRNTRAGPPPRVSPLG